MAEVAPRAELVIRRANDDELAMVALLNGRLIDDEGSRNDMSVGELHERLCGLIGEGWVVDLFDLEGLVVGYALHRTIADGLTPGGEAVHLRQFFVDRSFRRRGIGRLAFSRLLEGRWRGQSRIVLEVLTSNPGGAQFWSAVGFKHYASTLELTLSGEIATA